MTQTSEIESVKAALSVVIDDGDFIINSTGPVGKAMATAVLPLAASAHKVTIISDGEMKVMKRNSSAENQAKQVPDMADVTSARRPVLPASPVQPPSPAQPDIQDQFVADLAAGVTGEAATGETPSPTPGPSDPTPMPVKPPAPTRRKPQIFQDGAAPPAPELAEAEMDRLLAEAAQAEQDAARVAEDQRFQRQQAVQVGQEPEIDPAEAAAVKPAPHRREPRTLAVTGRPCGKCGGSGQTGIVGEGGAVFAGKCPVCQGEGQVQTFARGPKFR